QMCDLDRGGDDQRVHEAAQILRLSGPSPDKSIIECEDRRTGQGNYREVYLPGRPDQTRRFCALTARKRPPESWHEGTGGQQYELRNELRRKAGEDVLA